MVTYIWIFVQSIVAAFVQSSPRISYIYKKDGMLVSLLNHSPWTSPWTSFHPIYNGYPIHASGWVLVSIFFSFTCCCKVLSSCVWLGLVLTRIWIFPQVACWSLWKWLCPSSYLWPNWSLFSPLFSQSLKWCLIFFQPLNFIFIRVSLDRLIYELEETSELI